MKLRSLHLMLAFFSLAAATVQAADNPATRAIAPARDIVVPAGTLLTCTLDEPKFSSATVSVGDPFLCHPRTIQQFGQTVFPRGTYFVGHLEADKDPGHFVGKGYLKLAFDRIGLPDTDVPLTAKMVAVAGFNVDRQGRIIGHGHPTRDVVEWMLPPLWPWKVLTLPARGPRPTLKGETRVTLRVMDDITVPQFVRESTTPGWHRFGEQPSSFPFPRSQAAPQRRAIPAVSYQTAAIAAAPRLTMEPVDPLISSGPADPGSSNLGSSNLGSADPGLVDLTSQPIVSNVTATVASAAPMAPIAASAPRNAWPANVTLFALSDGTILPATQYWRDQGQLRYLSGSDKGTISLRDIDWGTTTRLNIARNVRVVLRNLPAEN
jgi:hypothetical protein